jgi:hypothetical protein
MNSHNDRVDFILPTLPTGGAWQRVLDTTEPALEPWPETLAMGATFAVPGRSLVVFAIPTTATAETAA